MEVPRVEIWRSPGENEREQGIHFLPVDEVPRGVGRRGAVAFLHEVKSERGEPLQRPGGVKDFGFSFFPSSNSLCWVGGNGHSDHFEPWTYPLFNTDMSTGFCK